MNLKSIIPWKKEDRAVARGHGEGEPLALLQRQMNSLFEEFFGPASSGPWSDFDGHFAPQIEMSESDKEVRISAELPGLDEKEVAVSLIGNLLTIKGEKKEEHEEGEGD